MLSSPDLHCGIPSACAHACSQLHHLQRSRLDPSARAFDSHCSSSTAYQHHGASKSGRMILPMLRPPLRIIPPSQRPPLRSEYEQLQQQYLRVSAACTQHIACTRDQSRSLGQYCQEKFHDVKFTLFPLRRIFFDLYHPRFI